MAKLELIHGDKKEPCPYCGQEPHSVPLACPRICAITIWENDDTIEIHFWPEEGDPDLPMAG